LDIVDLKIGGDHENENPIYCLDYLDWSLMGMTRVKRRTLRTSRERLGK